MSKSIGAAAVIVDAEGRILLVKHSYGKNNWDLPGGKSEANESAQQTAAREVLEETGLNVEVGQLTGIYYEAGRDHDMHHFVFLATIVKGQVPVPSSPEILECRYCSIDEWPRPISDFTRKRIVDALDANRERLFHTVGPRVWLE
ncbi:NUDIX hydrolase [Paenibacillus sacheonensis]|uniref:NUDIX domain-containing protein n=1 Tax=Paenibacillus sacheonensis TaxID=742054 RepID=A0A7X4YRI3_9BACL|nr:NUDIX hydrolase [Paenibacillus sacheonensis]MBM7564914.1 ADP-ribose pyrophosphatase YjhB (NUDIX family) [Paenibacillus sacheonensis]NBC70296.1 NUDIX domain-containing protein [Paenibacillus sacheonensis]